MSITPEQLAATGTEEGQQTALFCWLRHPETLKRYANYPSLAKAFAIPNGGNRGKGDRRSAEIEGARLKKQGVLAGVSDVFIPVPVARMDARYAGLFIEMKRPDDANSRPSVDQLTFGAAMRDAGYKFVICYTYAEAKAEIEAYLR